DRIGFPVTRCCFIGLIGPAPGRKGCADMKRSASLCTTTLLAVLVGSAGCSSESQGDVTRSFGQELEAGEFVLLNELEINPPGTDVPFAYLELEGTPGVSVADFQVLVVVGTTGSVSLSVDLGTACGGPCAI